MKKLTHLLRRFLSRRRAGNTDIGREAAIVRGHALVAVGRREGLGGDAGGAAWSWRLL